MIVQLPSWLRPLRRRPVTRRRRPRFGFVTESLESRTLLAGNVTAVVEDGNLTLTGDEADNSVEIAIVDGDIVVQGLEDTTVNGSADPFVVVEDTTTIDGDVEAALGDGDDTLRITGALTITGTTHIDDDAGASQIGVTDAMLDGSVDIDLGQADDDISFAGATLGSDLNIDASGGDNFISVFETTVTGEINVEAGSSPPQVHGLLARLLSRHSHGIGHHRHSFGEGFADESDWLWDDFSIGHLGFGRHLRRTWRGESGGQNDIVIEDSTVGSVSYTTGRGADNVIVQDSMIDGTVEGRSGSGNDFVMFDGATVADDTKLALQRGKDKLVTENENTFDGDVYANGGWWWKDAVQLSDETEFNGASKFRHFNSSHVSDAMIEMRGTDTLMAAAELRESLNGLEDGDGDEDTDPPALTVDTSMNGDTIESNDTLVTTLEMFTIAGQTAPGAMVGVVGGPNGGVDLGTTMADMDGNFSLDVTLLEGGTTIMVTSTTDGGSTTEEFNLHRAVGTVVRFTSSQGTFDVELFDDDAPITVANFMSYFDEYLNSFIHRTGDGTGGVPSVVQGGGFFLEGTEIEPIDTTAPIANEFNAMHSNLAGTLSMALSGDGVGGTDPDSGTSQWFFNLVDNVFLNANEHTVFGQVIGTGLEVLQDIQALPNFDIAASVESDLVGGFDPTDALTDVPLDGYDDLSEALPGTVSIAANNIVVTGTGTNFTTTLEPGELIEIDGTTRAVLEVNSDTMLTLTSAPTTAVTDATVFVNPVPTADELVLFSSIAEILPAPSV